MSDRSSVFSADDRLALVDTSTDDDGDSDAAMDHADSRKYAVPPSARLPRRSVAALGSAPAAADDARTRPADRVFDADAGTDGSDTDQDLHSPRLSRPSSTYSAYSLSRISFASQLAQLPSIKLPDATSLSARISSLPDSAAAASALGDSADQIRRWIRNAHTVLQGLDAEDDVEWAAAGGRAGLDDVDRAVSRFDKVVKLYVLSIEELHMRSDIASLSRDQVQSGSDDMDAVLREWRKVKASLAGVKEQVEVAMEWEELSNSVGTGISHELDDLAGLVFEMEEQRHQSVVSKPSASDADHKVDIDELKTIVEENPASARRASKNRLSLPAPFSPSSPLQATASQGNMEDNLLALFARMQPLRASLDFLPMRLSVFHCRGNSLFPTACLDLEAKRDSLEAQWKRLDTDAEALRRELGEDRWLLVFRNAGSQALNMCQSVLRSVEKLRSALDHGEQHRDPTSTAKKLESYEAKKNHYGSAIERVLAIIDRGVMDRLTVNGEILGLQSDMKRKWAGIQADMRELDSRLLDLNLDLKSQQLRDSISTIVSSEHSMTSSFMDTPRSSSASSVSRAGSDLTPRRSRASRFMSAIPRRTPQSNKHRDSAKPPLSRTQRSFTPSYSPSYTPYTPPPATDPIMRQFKAPSDKPRWNTSTVTRDSSLNFPPISAAEPSPYRRVTLPQRSTTPTTSSTSSKIPTLSPFSRSTGGRGHDYHNTPATPPSRRHASTPLSSPMTQRAQSSMAQRSCMPRAASSFHLGLEPRNGLESRSTSFSNLAPPPRVPSSLRKTSLLTPNCYDDENSVHAESEGKPSPKRTMRASSALASPNTQKSSFFGSTKANEGRRSRLDTASSAQHDRKSGWRM